MEYDDYLAHYGVKGMKWGVRKDGSKISRSEKKAARVNERNRVNENWEANKIKNIGALAVGTLVGGPPGAIVAGSYQMSRAQGFSRGKSAVISTVGGGVITNVVVSELNARKSTR